MVIANIPLLGEWSRKIVLQNCKIFKRLLMHARKKASIFQHVIQHTTSLVKNNIIDIYFSQTQMLQ